MLTWPQLQDDMCLLNANYELSQRMDTVCNISETPAKSEVFSHELGLLEISGNSAAKTLESNWISNEATGGI